MSDIRREIERDDAVTPTAGAADGAPVPNAGRGPREAPRHAPWSPDVEARQPRRTLEPWVRGWGARHAIVVDVVVDRSAGAGALPAPVEAVLQVIVREALANVVRHARAREVSVLLARDGGEWRLVVEDDGAGFDPDAIEARMRSTGTGLSGMREGAALVGGSVDVETWPGRGTSVYARVPLGAG
jgi:nitrate/nitrite-specific signal transduction histidine kinase